MIKNRLFLIGLGLGFILSGMFIIIFADDDFLNTTSPDTIINELTAEEIKDIATEKNLHIYTEEELNDLITNNSINENTGNLKDTTNVEDIKDSEEIKDVIISFIIYSDTGSEEVTSYLYELNIINDKSSFNALILNNNLATKILAGEYSCSKDITDIELIELITDSNQDNW